MSDQPLSQGEWERLADESLRRSRERRNASAESDPVGGGLVPRRPLVWVGVIVFLLVLLGVFFIAALAAVNAPV